MAIDLSAYRRYILPIQTFEQSMASYNELISTENISDPSALLELSHDIENAMQEARLNIEKKIGFLKGVGYVRTAALSGLHLGISTGYNYVDDGTSAFMMLLVQVFITKLILQAFKSTTQLTPPAELVSLSKRIEAFEQAPSDTDRIRLVWKIQLSELYNSLAAQHKNAALLQHATGEQKAECSTLMSHLQKEFYDTEVNFHKISGWSEALRLELVRINKRSDVSSEALVRFMETVARMSELAENLLKTA